MKPSTANTGEISFSVQHKIPLTRLSDLLAEAWDGGSAYWARAIKYNEPDEWKFSTSVSHGEGHHYGHEYPLNPNGSVVINDIEEDKNITLDWNKIQKGLKVFVEKFPQAYADFVDENDDAGTGDMFLQCCLFGDVIYG